MILSIISARNHANPHYLPDCNWALVWVKTFQEAYEKPKSMSDLVIVFEFGLWPCLICRKPAGTFIVLMKRGMDVHSYNWFLTGYLVIFLKTHSFVFKFLSFGQLSSRRNWYRS